MNRAFHSAPGRENAREQVDYTRIKATLAQRTDAAILVTTEKTVAAVWVPKRAIEISSRVAIERAALKSEIEFGLDVRTALEKGLI